MEKGKTVHIHFSLCRYFIHVPFFPSIFPLHFFPLFSSPFFLFFFSFLLFSITISTSDFFPREYCLLFWILTKSCNILRNLVWTFCYLKTNFHWERDKKKWNFQTKIFAWVEIDQHKLLAYYPACPVIIFFEKVYHFRFISTSLFIKKWRFKILREKKSPRIGRYLLDLLWSFHHLGICIYV